MSNEKTTQQWHESEEYQTMIISNEYNLYMATQNIMKNYCKEAIKENKYSENELKKPSKELLEKISKELADNSTLLENRNIYDTKITNKGLQFYYKNNIEDFINYNYKDLKAEVQKEKINEKLETLNNKYKNDPKFREKVDNLMKTQTQNQEKTQSKGRE